MDNHVYYVYINMLIIYMLIKLEQTLCTEYTLRTLFMYEYLFIIPIYLLPLNTISFILICILFVLTWMDYRIQSISDRLILLFYLCVLVHYILHPIQISIINLLICFVLLSISMFTKGLGLGDVYIIFGLSLLLNNQDFLFVLRNSFIIALIVESIKKTKVNFAYIPYIYYSLILFLSVNLY